MTGRQPQRAAHAGEPPLVAVYDGRACLGHVLGRGRAGFEAFDADNGSRRHGVAVSHGAHARGIPAG